HHGGLESNGKPADVFYGHKDLYRKVTTLPIDTLRYTRWMLMALWSSWWGSNNNQAVSMLMQTFVLAPKGSVANKFYLHTDIFRYQYVVFSEFVTEPQEESVEEETVAEPNLSQNQNKNLYLRYKRRSWSKHWKRLLPMTLRKARPCPCEHCPCHTGRLAGFRDQDQSLKLFSKVMLKPKNCLTSPQSPIHYWQFASQGGHIRVETFQNYCSIVELRINNGGKLPSFGFVMFRDSESIQKGLSNRPIMFCRELGLIWRRRLTGMGR
ncbi:LOW QUALITY PROTEIN: Ras GTPase-activating protein-binding protein 1, partial [Galemys pyrenaicus]